jgi:undecaprenyl phosphate N,N'-diacetylbacillosamine 1-phosphate transferase
MYTAFFKKILDIITSLLVLVVLCPIIILITVILIISYKGKPFFLQKRPGKNGEIFTILKFKTMNDQKDQFGILLPDTERITFIGSFMRKTSMDELLQLINVLKGEMSIVGPRPLLIEYLPLYNREQAKRHNVKPGITGWAQVNGRNTISWEQKFEYDVWYVDNVSFKTDLIIILKTIKKVFIREGISASKTETMGMFQGSNL